MSVKNQIVALDEREQKPQSKAKAEIYDEWVASLPEPERIQVNRMLANALELPNVGELLAKELVITTLGYYAARRPK